MISVADLPGGIFKSLLVLWETFFNTYVGIFSWMGETAFGDHGTVLSVLVGTGITAILGIIIVKWLKNIIF